MVTRGCLMKFSDKTLKSIAESLFPITHFKILFM